MTRIDYISFDRPQVGDIYHRYSLNGLFEEAMIISVIGPADDQDQWTAVLMTRNGAEFSSSGADYRNKFDWVPHTWIYDEFQRAWIYPKSESTEEGAQAQTPEAFNPAKIPGPVEGERFMTWRARVLKEIPLLKNNSEAKAMLSAVWRTREPGVSAK